MIDNTSTPTPSDPLATLRAELAALSAAQSALSQAVSDTAAALPAVLATLGGRQLALPRPVNYVSAEGDFHGKYETLVLVNDVLTVIDDNCEQTPFDDIDTALAAEILLAIQSSPTLR